jgi:cell wall-associated NlpC family hydrolase
MTPHLAPLHPALHPARHRINALCARGIVAAGLAMATLGGLLGAVPAVASPQLTSAQDRATQLRHTVDDLRVRTEQAAEAYDAAAAGLAAAVTEHGLADRQLTQAHADVAAGRNTMAARVRSLYVSGGPTALYASVIESHDLSDVFSRFRSVRAVAEGDQAVVDRADAALTRSGQVESALADAADRQNRLERAAAAAAAQVGQLLEQEAGVLAGADADVVRIAEADRRAEQEAAERAFQAQLAAAQATAAQAVQAARLAAQAAATADIGSGSQPGVGVAPAATEVGRAALAEAVRQIGKPYVWGAVGADSFDCSGLTKWAYARAGVGLPRVAAEQWYAGAHISLGDLAAGDLLFWATDPANPATIHHVAIYAGNGQMVAAPHTGALVQLQPVYLAGYIGAVRPSAGP